MEFSGGLSLRDSPCFSPATCSSLSSNNNILNRVEFRDKGHLQYYVRCGGDDNKKKKKKKQSIKKNLKLVKSLCKDLPVFSDSDLLHQNPQAILLQETAQGLMKQLQELRAKEKELMTKKKQHKKPKLQPTTMLDSQSSSQSSSESSDSEPEEVIPMSRFTTEAAPVAPLLPAQQFNATATDPFLHNTPSHLQKQCSPNGDNAIPVSVCSHDRNSFASSSAKRIEVCMGTKCKKSGGAALLEEFQRVLGAEAAVVGCKCMGKCRDGPNVRATNFNSNSVTTLVPPNPLYIGVGLEDVSVTVASFSSEDKESLGLALAPAS